MSEDQLSGWTTNIWPSGVQHYVKAGKEYTACSRYSVYKIEKPLLISLPDKKRKVCGSCAKIYNKEKNKSKTSGKPINIMQLMNPGINPPTVEELAKEFKKQEGK